jgi:isocitrate/isopropylmalate dehydrogenase
VSKRIAVIPGDGVGLEVVAQGVKALGAVCRELEFETFP